MKPSLTNNLFPISEQPPYVSISWCSYLVSLATLCSATLSVPVQVKRKFNLPRQQPPTWVMFCSNLKLSSQPVISTSLYIKSWNLEPKNLSFFGISFWNILNWQWILWHIKVFIQQIFICHHGMSIILWESVRKGLKGVFGFPSLTRSGHCRIYSVHFNVGRQSGLKF